MSQLLKAALLASTTTVLLLGCVQAKPGPTNPGNATTKVSAIAADSMNGGFYSDRNQNSDVKNFVTDFGGNGLDDKDDSNALNAAITQMSKSGGGTLILPVGRYYVNDVVLKSNVNLDIEEGVTLFPEEQGKSKSSIMFMAGTDKETARNVSLRGLGDGFTVDLRGYKDHTPGIRVVQFGDVDNFYVGNFTVEDNFTKFSSVTFNPSRTNGEFFGARNGVVTDVAVKNSHYGYGVAQIKAGVNVLFQNFDGDGGVALRLETGGSAKNFQMYPGLMGDITVRNINCTNGNAALMISPHERKLGKVTADTITSNNCGFAVRVGRGFVEKPLQKVAGIERGTFEPSTVSNVTAIYGETSQLKEKHFKFMPCALRDKPQKTVFGKSEKSRVYSGPSISAVVNTADSRDDDGGGGYYDVAFSNVKAIGFDEQPHDIATESDAIKKCKT